MAETPFEQIDKRIRAVFQDALNKGHEFRTVFGPDLDLEEEAMSVDVRLESER